MKNPPSDCALITNRHLIPRLSDELRAHLLAYFGYQKLIDEEKLASGTLSLIINSEETQNYLWNVKKIIIELI